MRGHSLL